MDRPRRSPITVLDNKFNYIPDISNYTPHIIIIFSIFLTISFAYYFKC